MIIKKHVSNAKLILAVCDKNLLGKVFSDDNIVLDLNSEFYSGEEMSTDEVKNLMKQAYIINLCGVESLNAAKEINLVTDNNPNLTVK